jgi:hypothetical protein
VILDAARRVVAVETLPPPSPDADMPTASPERPPHVPRAGELTPGWRVVTGLGWILVLVVLAAAWSVSRQLGLSTWWLGPAHDQRPPYVVLIPFVAPAILIALVGNRVRYIPWIGLLAAAATAAVGFGDLGRIRGVGVVELLAAGAGLLVSVASFSGMYRIASGSVTDDVAVLADTGDDRKPVGVTDPADVDDAVAAPAYRAGEPAPG